MRSATQEAPRFQQTYCSQCGQDQGPGKSGFSRCADHEPRFSILAVSPVNHDGDGFFVDVEASTPARLEYTTDGQLVRITQSHIGGADDLSKHFDARQMRAIAEAAWIKADLHIDALKNSGELRRRDDARAMALQLQWDAQ